MSSHKKKSTSRLHTAEPMPVSDMDWRARGDMEALKRAEEIKADKKRMAAAQKCAKEDMACLQKVAGKK